MGKRHKNSVFDVDAIMNQLAQLKFNEINRPFTERESTNINGHEVMVSTNSKEAIDDLILFGATLTVYKSKK